MLPEDDAPPVLRTTYGDIVDRARETLNDQNPDAYRWTDEQLLRFAHDGVVELGRRRPASKYLAMRLVRRVHPSIPDGGAADLAALRAAPLLVEEQWHQALVEYALYRALRMDEADTINLNLSQNHYQQFISLALS